VKGLRAYNSVNDLLLGREFNILNLWVWRRKCDNRTVENGGFHCTTNHGVGQQGANSFVTVRRIGITEILLESLPVHTVICLEEAEVWEEPSVVSSAIRHKANSDRGRGKGKEDLLFKPIQQRRTGQAPPIHTLEILTGQTRPRTIVLDSLRFIQHDSVPVNLMQIPKLMHGCLPPILIPNPCNLLSALLIRKRELLHHFRVAGDDDVEILEHFRGDAG
jgi:hypothetical protein